jgi:hypothetical protein
LLLPAWLAAGFALVALAPVPPLARIAARNRREKFSGSSFAEITIDGNQPDFCARSAAVR